MRFVVKIIICLLFLVVGAFFLWQVVKLAENPPPKQTQDENVEVPTYVKDELALGKSDGDASQKHWRTFLLLTSKDPKDPKAARDTLSKFIQSRYGQHPLADEWIDLTLRMRLDRKSSLLDTLRGLEIQIELLKSLGGGENMGRIETLQKSLKMFNRTLKSVQEAGGDPQTIMVGFRFDTPSQQQNIQE